MSFNGLEVLFAIYRRQGICILGESHPRVAAGIKKMQWS
jgi:hypothetical protein